MAMNFVCGGGMPRWTAFHWKSATAASCSVGRARTTIMAHIGAGNLDEAYPSSEVAPLRIEELKEENFLYGETLLQVTNIPA